MDLPCEGNTGPTHEPMRWSRPGRASRMLERESSSARKVVHKGARVRARGFFTQRFARVSKERVSSCSHGPRSRPRYTSPRRHPPHSGTIQPTKSSSPSSNNPNKIGLPSSGCRARVGSNNSLDQHYGVCRATISKARPGVKANGLMYASILDRAKDPAADRGPGSRLASLRR